MFQHSQLFSSIAEKVAANEGSSDSDDSAVQRQRRRPTSTSNGGGNHMSPQLPKKRAKGADRQDARKKIKKSVFLCV